MEQENNINEEQVQASPFANSPYETPYGNPEYQAPKPKKTKARGKRWTAILLVLAFVVAGCGITALGVNAYWNCRFERYSKVVENKLQVQQEQLDAALRGVTSGGNGGQSGSGAPSLVYAQNVQSVVAISNQGLTTNIFGQVSETASSGSGFIISEDGYVVSNYHVVKGATKLKVITADSKEYDAELVGYDATNDLSVLKIDATGLPFVKLGSSESLAIGDQVAAIGNPLGELTSTLTVGYVSAKDRMVSTDGTNLNMLQTDAAINSGNSGGPLFNMKGEVVGITTAKYSGTSGSGATIEGIGFAIPIDDVSDMIADLMEKGYVSGAYLGVTVKDMNQEVADAYGLPAGAYVNSVEENGAAAKAGIQAKDIIINLGGHEVTSMATLTRALRKLEPGQTTTVTVFRSGAEVNLEITLAEKPKPAPEQAPQETVPETQPSQQTPNFGGIEDWFGGFFPDFG